MSDDLVLGGINFGPANPLPDKPTRVEKITVKPRPVELSDLTGRSQNPPLLVRCLISECPNNTEHVCRSPQTINIGLDCKCRFGDDARKHAWEQQAEERRDDPRTS